MKFSELFLPSNCISCNREPEVICPDCRFELGERCRPVTRGELHGFSLLEYDSRSAIVMHAFKAKAMFALGRTLAKKLAVAQPVPEVDLLVAAPSASLATRQRGFVPSQIIATSLGHRWRVPVVVARLTRAVADQAGLSASQRRDNLAGAFAVGRPLEGKRVWLVDDIVTSGATLLELAAACRAAGAVVAGFSTIAETSLKTSAQS